MPTGYYGMGLTVDVDYKAAYHKILDDLVQFNQDPSTNVVAKFTVDTEKERADIFLHMMEFATGSEGFTPYAQRPDRYTRNIPLNDRRLGIRRSDIFWQDASQDEVDAFERSAMLAYKRLLAREWFNATVRGDAGGSKLGFWNNHGTNSSDWDGTTLSGYNAKPITWKNNSFDDTHDHYTATGSTTISIDDFTDIKAEITEHGYGLHGKLATFMSQSTAADFEKVAGWDTVLTRVPLLDTISEVGVVSGLSFNGQTIVVDDWMPDDYLMSVDTQVKPVVRRQPLKPKYRGLNFFKGPHDEFPFEESYWQARHGYVVAYKGAGAVRYIESSWSSAGAEDFSE